MVSTTLSAESGPISAFVTSTNCFQFVTSANSTFAEDLRPYPSACASLLTPARRSLLRPLRCGRGGGGEPLQPLRRGSFIRGGGRGGRACQLSAAVRQLVRRGESMKSTWGSSPNRDHTTFDTRRWAGAYGQARTRRGSAQSSLPEPRLEEKYLLCAPPNWAVGLDGVWDFWELLVVGAPTSMAPLGRRYTRLRSLG